MLNIPWKKIVFLTWGILVLLFIIWSFSISFFTKDTHTNGSIMKIIQKESIKAPALPGGETSLRVFRQNIFEKTKTNSQKIYQTQLNDIFRLELSAQKFEQNISIPKYWISKDITAWQYGVLEFQTNLTGTFDIFCNQEKNPCALLTVEKISEKE